MSLRCGRSGSKQNRSQTGSDGQEICSWDSAAPIAYGTYLCRIGSAAADPPTIGSCKNFNVSQNCAAYLDQKIRIPRIRRITAAYPYATQKVIRKVVDLVKTSSTDHPLKTQKTATFLHFSRSGCSSPWPLSCCDLRRESCAPLNASTSAQWRRFRRCKTPLQGERRITSI